MVFSQNYMKVFWTEPFPKKAHLVNVYKSDHSCHSYHAIRILFTMITSKYHVNNIRKLTYADTMEI